MDETAVLDKLKKGYPLTTANARKTVLKKSADYAAVFLNWNR